jgi:hypothetical protein
VADAEQKNQYGKTYVCEKLSGGGKKQRAVTRALRPDLAREEDQNEQRQNQKSLTIFLLTSNKITSKTQRSLPSLTHLILRNKNEFLAH